MTLWQDTLSIFWAFAILFTGLGLAVGLVAWAAWGLF